MGKPREILIDQLVPPKVLLRPVQQNTVEFFEMKDSIKSKGILNSILVRPSSEFEDKYEVIDGMYRWTCIKELGLKSVPVVIMRGVSDIDALALQVQTNAIRPKTKPCEFAKQLQRIQKEIPGISLSEIAGMVSKTPSWVKAQLRLLNLNQAQHKMVDRGEICLQNAYMLAKMPPYLREQYIDHAKVMKVKIFAALTASVVKKFREDVRQGKLNALSDTFQPQAYLRSLKEIETDSVDIAPLVIVSEDCKTAIDGWEAAIKWIMHLDNKSIEAQRGAFQTKIRA